MDDNERIDQALAIHCAPTLLGLKAASLFALIPAHFCALSEALQASRQAYAGFGLELLCLRQSARSRLILLYRPDLLRQSLNEEARRTYLSELGYPAHAEGLEALLGELFQRFQGHQAALRTFPHEIGLFLDYPVSDVKAFIEEGPQKSKFSGLWKVYSHENEARALFERFHQARRQVLAGLDQGLCLSEQLSHSLNKAVA